MKLGSLLSVAWVAAFAAVPASAWSGSAPAGEQFAVTATILPAGNGARSLSLALTPQGSASAQGMTMHAWFVDAEGMILAPATLGGTRTSGATLVALDPSLKVPANAASLVVLTQPALRRASGTQAPATVSQIALPTEVTARGGA